MQNNYCNSIETYNKSKINIRLLSYMQNITLFIKNWKIRKIFFILPLFTTDMAVSSTRIKPKLSITATEHVLHSISDLSTTPIKIYLLIISYI